MKSHRLCVPFALAMLALSWGRAADSKSDANAALRPWTQYQTILWLGDSAFKEPGKRALVFQRLREMGINTGMVHGEGDPQPLLENAFPYYVENMVNRGLCLKWNSKVRDWDAFVTGWARGGRPASAFIRDYCLDDPQWLAWAREQMQRLARKHRVHQPLAYDIRDELSTTISANPFDYDFNPATLAAFRTWLKTQYADLTALNAQWGTRFNSWDEVQPFTTDQIKNRMASGEAIPRGSPDWQALQRVRFDPVEAAKQPARWNFAPWCDFRTYMDISLARALGDLRQAARAVDPQTPVGIEGTQMPHAFGGYDLWRLSQVLDWVEPYDIGNAREILGSFMPGKPILTTVFEKDTSQAMRRLWHLLLEGDRGCIVWWSEDCLDWKSPDYALTAKAKALAPALKEMTSPLARLYLRAEKEHDPIAIHYSQPSIQVNWLLESTVDGSTWHRRFSSFEADHNRMACVRNAWLKAFQDLGYSPRFISTAQIQQGELVNSMTEVLVLTSASALTDAEGRAMTQFLTRAGLREPIFRDGRRNLSTTIFSDGSPGHFDARGKLKGQGLMPEPFLPALSNARAYAAHTHAKTSVREGDIAGHTRERLSAQPQPGWLAWIATNTLARREVIVRSGNQEITLTRVHRFRLGAARLLAFERNIDYHMSEDLKQAGGNENLEKPIELEATLATPGHVYDLRAGKYLGETRQIRCVLDPWQPSLYAVTEKALATGDILPQLEAQAAAR